MGILDSVMQMQSQGKTEPEIIQILQSQGVPPKQIQDAMSQAQIKNAVSGSSSQTENMQESIMEQAPQEQYPAPTPNQNYSQPPMEMPSQYPQETYPQESYQQQEYYPPQDYYQQQDYGYSGGSDTSTLMEISEQVFTEKIKKIQTLLDSLNEFKTLTDAKVIAMEERLRRIESTIDTLQESILDKIGSYGQNLNSIKKEMAMMQDSFGKVINPILDKRRKT